MVDEDQYCIDVIKQIQAVQAALDKVKTIILDEHLHTCVSAAIRGDDADERERHGANPAPAGDSRASPLSRRSGGRCRRGR